MCAQARLDDAEQNALKGGKKAMAKMDSRIRLVIAEDKANGVAIGWGTYMIAARTI